MANNYFNRIVQLNVSQTVAPTPSGFQQTAAVVSMGGTTISSGSTQYIADSSQLATYLKSAFTISTLTWSTGVATVTCATAHGIPTTKTTNIVISGCTPAGYNGTFIATATTSTALTFALASNPGSLTVPGNLQTGPQVDLAAFNTTWWAQGNSQVGYYVYESGSAAVATVTASVDTYIAAHPQTIYNWCLLPMMADDQTATSTWLLTHNALTSLIKFYLPLTSSNYSSWASSSTLKNTFAMVESPNGSVTSELDVASFAQYMTSFIPTPTNKLPPSQYTFLNGVSAYSPLTQTLINAFINADINFVSTGAEGGISNTILVAGKNFDGTPANVAYSIDWVQVNLNLDISNAVINGSNNTVSPLYYNQDGINFLQQVAATTASRAIASGLALGQVIVTSLDSQTFATNVSTGKYAGNFVINAVPFQTYVATNPSDYANQLYGGFSAAYVPQYGFETIVFNLNVTQFA